MNSLLLMIALPLLAAFLLPVVDRVSPALAKLTGPVVLAITGILGIILWAGMTAPIVVQLGGFRPPMGITFYADQLSLMFAVAISLGTLLLWPDESEQPLRQSTLALLLAAAGAGLALSGDLFDIYVFYELVAVASYGLVASRLHPAALAATLRYLIVSAFGAVLILAGIALIYQATGTLNLAQLAQLAPQKLYNVQGLSAFVLMLIGFGVKAELFPVNAWVPEVYATAPVRVSALLAGVASKLALLVVVKLLVLVFQQPEAHLIVLVLGILGLVSGELAAWRATDFKRMLAFSSIGQLGTIFIAFSVPGEAGVFAGLAVGLHHLVVKPAMFLLARRWGGSLSNLAGAAKTAPLAAALFVLLALSLIGVPPLPGFWAKLLVLVNLAGQGQWLYYLGGLAILFGAALEANYLFRVASSFYTSPGQTLPLPAHKGKDLLVASLLTGTLVAGVFFISPLADNLYDIAHEATDVKAYIDSIQPVQLTPLGAFR